jgi:hypothetical protein
VAAGRRNGGSTSRRPNRHQLAVLLGEVLLQALEQPDLSKTSRLQTVASLARVTLGSSRETVEKERQKRLKRKIKRIGTGR